LYIDTQEGLEELIAACSGSSVLTLDTEFLREKTYYPQLCLLQIATETYEAIIDPFAPLDLTALTPLLTDAHVMKVVHAGQQDLAILYATLNTTVRPVFDTQRAALLLGLPQQISLATLVRHFCGATLNKEDSFSDWARRPLTQKQLDYALDDVHYLPSIYRKMRQQLVEAGRLEWLQEDFEAMADAKSYRNDVREAWKKLKGTAAFKGRRLAVLRELAAWRELTAQRCDIPRKWVLSDDFIVEIAKREPSSLSELFQIRGLSERLESREARAVLRAIATARRLPESSWPAREHPQHNPTALAAGLDLAHALLHHRARELHVADSFLANRDELIRLVSGQREDLALLTGWRQELIGNELIRLLDGGISLSLEGSSLKVTLASQATVPSAQ
jgi:ribonuclease D